MFPSFKKRISKASYCKNKSNCLITVACFATLRTYLKLFRLFLKTGFHFKECVQLKNCFRNSFVLLLRLGLLFVCDAIIGSVLGGTVISKTRNSRLKNYSSQNFERLEYFNDNFPAIFRDQICSVI